jgi:NAD(P)H-hydrate epimerase
MKEEMVEGITSEEMAALDENCKFFGLSPLQLMENAGAGIANEIKKRFERGEEKVKITIIAGKGNNGGDAFAAARHLDGFDVEILLIGRSKDLRTEEARRNWRILKASEYEIKEITDSSELKARLLADSELIMDAIFGTGVRGKIREPEVTAIDLINLAKDAFIVAVDIPSGLDPDTGEAEKAVRANLTVTFHKPKKGLLKREAKKYVGELVVANIGIPEAMEKLAGPGDIRMVAKRKPGSHKGDNGRVLIVGGGPYIGAPTLAALGALRAGADWVTIAAPKSVSSLISSLSPNLIVQPLNSEILVEEDVPEVLNLIKKHDVVVIGMGLGKAEETKRATELIIEDDASKKVVVDADGFYGLHLPIQTLKSVIITPHAGEFSKMESGLKRREIKVPAEDMMEERIKFVKDFSKLNKIVTLMKGPTDIISDGTRVKINKKGNAGMTVGGTGDVLAGITGAFFAIADDPFKAATAAAFVNGAAGDLAFEEKGYGLLATDVMENIPKIIKDFR